MQYLEISFDMLGIIRFLRISISILGYNSISKDIIQYLRIKKRNLYKKHLNVMLLEADLIKVIQRFVYVLSTKLCGALLPVHPIFLTPVR